MIAFKITLVHGMLVYQCILAPEEQLACSPVRCPEMSVAAGKSAFTQGEP